MINDQIILNDIKDLTDIQYGGLKDRKCRGFSDVFW
jgi:hypothetical protein